MAKAISMKSMKRRKPMFSGESILAVDTSYIVVSPKREEGKD